VIFIFIFIFHYITTKELLYKSFGCNYLLKVTLQKIYKACSKCFYMTYNKEKYGKVNPEYAGEKNLKIQSEILSYLGDTNLSIFSYFLTKTEQEVSLSEISLIGKGCFGMNKIESYKTLVDLKNEGLIKEERKKEKNSVTKVFRLTGTGKRIGNSLEQEPNSLENITLNDYKIKD